MTQPPGVPAAEQRTRWLGGLAVFLMAMTPLVGYLAPLGSATVLTLVGLLATPGLARSRPPVLPMFALLLLVLWAVISLAWSPAAPHWGDFKRSKDLEDLTILKLVLEVGLYATAYAALGGMSTRSARLASRVMAVGVILLALLTFLDGLSKGVVYMALRQLSGDPVKPDIAVVKVSMGTYTMVLLFWPVVRLLDAWKFPGRNILIALTALMILIGAHLTGADAPIAAMLLAGVAWLGVRLIGKPFVRAMIPIVSAIFIFAPMAILWAVRSGLFAWLHVLAPPSWDARLNIWAYAANLTVDHALRGWGFDAARTFLGIPLHTHNAALQLWLELGSVGAALAAAFFAWILYRIVGQTEENRRDGAMAAATLTAFLVIGGVSFGVWQEWWLALGVIAAIACGVAQKTSAAAK
uniref:O-antigen ligase family protein n=1 Tax=uncultured Caulobacter sp. TaxID=158749 RepID=UPI00260001A0|nr:O-antigen ligase family protein [uncultured Caulobacter sp.]